MEAQKRRRANFNDEELTVLIREAFKRRTIVMGKFDGSVTGRKKNQAWEEITSVINNVSPCGREKDEIKKKFVDFKSFVRRKDIKRKSELEKIGGEEVTFTPIEKLMLSFLNETAIHGLDIPESETPLSPLTAVEAQNILHLDDQMELTEPQFISNGCNAKYFVKSEDGIHEEDVTIELESVPFDQESSNNDKDDDADVEDEEYPSFEVDIVEVVSKQSEKKQPSSVKSPSVSLPVTSYASKSLNSNGLKGKSPSTVSSSSSFACNSSSSNFEPPNSRRLTMENILTTSPISSFACNSSSSNFGNPNNKRLKKEIQYSKVIPSLESVFSSFFAAKADDENDPDLLFFRGLLPDIRKLSERHNRTFRANVLSSLNSLLDKQDSVCVRSMFSEKSNESISTNEENAKSLSGRTIVMSGHIDSSGLVVGSNVEKNGDNGKQIQEKRT